VGARCAQAAAIAATRENARYLPGIALPASLAVRCESMADLSALAGP
jgi:glycerol-3-phosphate dehydrogenase